MGFSSFESDRATATQRQEKPFSHAPVAWSDP